MNESEHSLRTATGRPVLRGSGKRRFSLAVILGLLVTLTPQASLLARAAGGTSDTFSILDFSQCANGAPPSVSTACPKGWINGELNAQNSHYAEDQVVPQRAVVNLPAEPAVTHTMTISYLDRKGGAVGGHHAYDYLATWNYTQTTADRCQGLLPAECPAASTLSTYPMPADPTPVPPSGAGISDVTSAHEAGISRYMTMYNATITAVSAPTHSDPLGTGDDEATVTVTFIPMFSNGGDFQLLFGGHLAASAGPRGWGAGLGSGTISGSPYHILLTAFDTASVGNRDNQILSAAILLPGAPAFTITKTATPTTTTPGAPVAYSFTVTNTGTGGGVATVTDTYAPATIVSVPLGCTDNTLTSTLVCTTTTLNPGASQTFTYTATMPTSFTGSSGASPCGPNQYPVVDTVVVTGGATATATVCVTALPGFTVRKSASSSTSLPGGVVTYTVTVTNDGAAPGAATVTDTYAPATIDTFPPSDCSNDASTSTLTCTTGTLAPGGFQSFVYTATMPATFLTGSGTLGCAAGQYPVVDTVVVTGGASAKATVCVIALPVFTITKSASSVTATVGGVVTYTFTVTNTGTAPGVATVTDTYAPATLTGAVPSGCTNTGSGPMVCTTTTLNPGASQTFTYTATMPASFTGTPGPGCAAGQFPVVDTVVVTGGARASATVCVPALPAFTITKSAGSVTSTAGGVVTYTITVTNTGTAPGVATVTDTYAPATLTGAVPSGCTNTGSGPMVCTTTTLNPGASQTFTYTATMPAAFLTGSGTLGCGSTQFPVVDNVVVTGGATATATVCVTALPAFTITKSASPTATTPGGLVTYTFTVTNTGSAPGVATVTDTYAPATLSGAVPSGCTNTGSGPMVCTTTTLNPGASQIFTYAATVPASFPDGSPDLGCGAHQFGVLDTVVVTGGDTAKALVCVTALPNFTIAKSASPATSTPGGTVTYTVTVVNTGTAAGVATVTDTYAPATLTGAVPSGCTNTGSGPMVCTTTTLNPGASQTFTYTATMPLTFPDGSPDLGCGAHQFGVLDTVVVTGGDTAKAIVCVTALPNFTIAKSASSVTSTVAGVVTYTVTVTNTGTAAGVATVTDTYAPATLIGILPAGCTNTGTGPMICTTTTLNPGVSETFVYTALMPLSFPAGSPDLGCGAHQFGVVDTVVVTGGATATATVCVSALAAFTVTKSASPTTSTPGGVVTYTVTVTNDGTGPGVATVTDTYAPATINGTVAGCTDDTGASTLTCTTSMLNPAASQTFTYTATMPSSFTAGSATAGCATGQFPVVDNVVVTGGDTASATVCVIPAAVLGSTLTQTPPTTPTTPVVAPQVLGTAVAPEVLGTTLAQTLPFTGFNAEWLLLAASVLFAAGSVILLISKRRRGLAGES